MALIYAIDDDASFLDCYSRRFRNHEFVGFTSAEQGLRTIFDRKPDVLICDLCMPWLDGYAVVDAVKRLDPNIPIIIATCMEDDEYRIAAGLAGCFFWEKSGKFIDLEELVKCQLTKTCKA